MTDPGAVSSPLDASGRRVLEWLALWPEGEGKVRPLGATDPDALCRVVIRRTAVGRVRLRIVTDLVARGFLVDHEGTLIITAAGRAAIGGRPRDAAH